MDVKHISSKLKSWAPLFLPLLIVPILLLVSPPKSSSILFLSESGCLAVQAAGLNQTPVKNKICSVEGVANWRMRTVEISGVVISREYVIADTVAKKHL